MYLSNISITNFRGIENLSVNFQADINIIIGENGSNKTALIDAIRLLSNLGNQQKDIYVSLNDFHKESDQISIVYILRDLSDIQKGAFHEYLVLQQHEKDDYARVKLVYKKNGRKVVPTYYAGERDERRAFMESLSLFRHCYLGALRDSTRDLVYSRSNILGTLIHRKVERNKTEQSYEELITSVNEKILELPEVIGARDSINTNLKSMFRTSDDNHIGVRIESKKSDYIVNIIKPFLPHDKSGLKGDGFHLEQNSLGFNNLIYTATILGDINESIKDDEIPLYSLLIEEPEAHLHPQLQLSLFEFLKRSKPSTNSQLFITSHSPTLTSKVPLDNLIVLSKMQAVTIGALMDSREVTGLDSRFERIGDAANRKAQLERYIDVTKSQMFFSKSILFVEGISEELLVPVFCKIINKSFVDYLVEIVNVDGTSFYPFLSLFIGDPPKCLDLKAAIITDDDRYTKSKDSGYSFDELIKDAKLLEQLKENIETSDVSTRISNIKKYVNSSNGKLSLHSSFKTFEFSLIKENISNNKTVIKDNLLLTFLNNYMDVKNKISIELFVKKISGNLLTPTQQFFLALLYWKAVPSKAQFAQDFSIHLEQNLTHSKTSFTVPAYIINAITHLIPTK